MSQPSAVVSSPQSSPNSEGKQGCQGEGWVNIWVVTEKARLQIQAGKRSFFHKVAELRLRMKSSDDQGDLRGELLLCVETNEFR